MSKYLTKEQREAMKAQHVNVDGEDCYSCTLLDHADEAERLLVQCAAVIRLHYVVGQCKCPFCDAAFTLLAKLKAAGIA